MIDEFRIEIWKVALPLRDRKVNSRETHIVASKYTPRVSSYTYIVDNSL